MSRPSSDRKPSEATAGAVASSKTEENIAAVRKALAMIERGDFIATHHQLRVLDRAVAALDSLSEALAPAAEKWHSGLDVRGVHYP